MCIGYVISHDEQYHLCGDHYLYVLTSVMWAWYGSTSCCVMTRFSLFLSRFILTYQDLNEVNKILKTIYSRHDHLGSNKLSWCNFGTKKNNKKRKTVLNPYHQDVNAF